MTTRDVSNDQQGSSNVPEAKGSKRRFFLLIGLLTIALFALWYDYKVARPAVEQAYDRIAAANDKINEAAEHRRMTSADVQSALKRHPNETFPRGPYTIEAYRWSAGMPIELRGLGNDESPGIGLKTHDYYAVYRKDGPELAFVTHFKFDLDPEYFAEKKINEGAAAATGMLGMGENAAGPGGAGTGFASPGGGGPGGPTDGGTPGGEGQGEDGGGRQRRPPLEPSDDEPAAPATTSDAAPAAEAKEAPAETTPEKPAAEPAAETTPEATNENAKEESGSES